MSDDLLMVIVGLAIALAMWALVVAAAITASVLTR
jgi:hypothetical protein